MAQAQAGPNFPVNGPVYTAFCPAAVAAGAHLGGVTRFVRSSGAPYEFPGAYGTLTAALADCRSGDTIILLSDLREEVTGSNLLFDITIIGAATRPRHDDKHNFTSTYQIGTSSWRNSSGVTTTPLIKVRAQGWRFVNIMFDAPTSAAAVYLERNALSGESEYDASHASFKNCRFVGGDTGIQDVGGHFNVRVEDCEFQALTNGIKCTSTAVAVPLQWRVMNCLFVDNTNHVLTDGSKWEVKNNTFGKFTTMALSLHNSAQGANNAVVGNQFAGDYDAKYLGGTNDEWSGNYSMDTGSGEVGAEGLTTAAPIA